MNGTTHKLISVFKKYAALTQQDVDNYINQYYADTPDAAHGVEHIDAVRDMAARLSDGVDVDRQAVDAAALLHDIGNIYSRDKHERIGAKLLKRDPVLRKAFDRRTRRDIIHAVRQHRASSGKPKTPLAKIVADADRLSSFTSPGSALLRAYTYGEYRFPDMTEEQQIRRSAGHLKEKFAPGGYGYNAVHNEAAKAIMADRMRDIVEAYDADDIERLKAILAAAKSQ